MNTSEYCQPQPAYSCADSSDDECEKFTDVKDKLGDGGLFESDDECSGEEMGFPRACKPAPACPPKMAPSPCASQIGSTILRQQQPVPVAGQISGETAEAADDATGMPQSKTYLVEFQTSLQELAAKPERSIWKMDPSAHWTLKKELSSKSFKKNSDRKLVGNPQKSLIDSIEVKALPNDNPCNRKLLASFPSLKPNKFDSRGNGYHFSVDSGSAAADAVRVYAANKEATVNAHLKEYTNVTEETLNATYVQSISEGYSNVKSESPIVKVMQINKQWAGMINNESKKEDDGIVHYKLPTDTVEKVKGVILGMIQKLPHTDLTDFAIEFRRSDGLAWDDTRNLVTLTDDPAEAVAELSRKFDCAFEITINYRLAKH